MAAMMEKPESMALMAGFVILLGAGIALVAITNFPNAGFTTVTGAAVTQRCFDSDAGQNIFEYSYVVYGGNTYLDSCLDYANLREAWCNGNALDYNVIECAYGCDEGACKQE